MLLSQLDTVMVKSILDLMPDHTKALEMVEHCVKDGTLSLYSAELLTRMIDSDLFLEPETLQVRDFDEWLKGPSLHQS